MYHKMVYVKNVGFTLLVLATWYHGQASGQYVPFEGADLASSYSFQPVRNLSSFLEQFGSGFNNLGLSNLPFVNSSGITNGIREIFDSPALKLGVRVLQLYQNEAEPVDILIDVLPSPEMQELISVWLSRAEIPAEQIKAVQDIVLSPEIVVLIRTVTNVNASTTTGVLCAVHSFTKVPEVRQLLDYVLNVSTTIELPDIPQLNDFSGSLNELSQLMNLDATRISDFLFSPVIQAFLEVFCELAGRGDVPNSAGLSDLNLPPFNLLNRGSETTDFPKSGAQALSSVANLTNASPNELLAQLQGVLTSPDLAEAIGNLNLDSSLNINDLLTQVGTALSTGNITAIQQLVIQFQNGSQGNETVAIAELVTQLTQQANATLSVVLPFVRQYIENVWRSALSNSGVSEACQDNTVVYAEALMRTETWALQFLDAYGKVPGGLLTLPLRWLGSFDECISIRSTGGEDISGKYCRSVFAIDGLPAPGLTLGTCVPDSCNAVDTLGILLTVQRLLLNGTTPVVPTITCVEEKEFETDAIIVTCVLVIFGFIVLCGTLYDVVSVQMKSEHVAEKQSVTDLRESVVSTTSSSSASTSDSNIPASLYKPIKTRLETSPGFVNNAYTSGEEFNKNADDFADIRKQTAPLDDIEKRDVIVNMPNSKEELVKPSAVPNKGVMENVMLSFSAYTNGVKILSTHQANGSLGSIHGIRFLSMAWVIMGHTYAFGADYDGALENAMLSFSAYTNGVKILSTHQASGSLGSIHGIRFLSMAWVILGHTIYFVQNYDDNLLTYYVEKLNHWTFASITYATVSVDSFFTISGILVGYLTLRHLKKVGGALKMNWFMFYFHRFWRLTPPYMLIMMVATVILPYVATGPMWNEEDFPGTGGCRKYWWTNLLYVNNYVNVNPTTEMCMGWTWYLANDMQFYIISPLILLPLFYNVIAGIVSCVLFLAATLITTGVLVHKYEYSAQEANLVYAPLPEDEYYFQRIYIPAYSRMGPYVIGLFTGYLLYRLDCKCRIPKALNLLGWLICLAICCCDVYGLYSYKDDHILTRLQSDVFLALHRTGWGVAVSWIVFACATGHGGWINQVLSWKPFIPLGRLTYGAYLIHPLVIFLFTTSRRSPTFFSDFEAAYLFIGHITLSYGAAFIVSLFFESPMMGLEKVFFNPQKKK